MNQLSEFFQQLRTLFAGMTPQSRFTSILLTGILIVSSVLLVQGYTGSSSSMVYLFDGKVLSEEDVDRIEIALSNAALRRWERSGNRIKVPGTSKDEYYKAIADGKAMPEGMGSAFEAALNGGNFLESTRMTDAKLLNAKLKQLANAIKRSDAIIQDAVVNYDKSRSTFSSEHKQTASVGIKTRGNQRLTTSQAHGIRVYVAKSFAGLDVNNVTLLDLNTLQPSIVSEDPTILAQDRYYQIKRERESEYKEKAEKLLADYENVKVEANVDLDPTISEETDALTYGEKPTTIQSTTSKRDSTNQRFPPQGRPGTEPNALANTGKSLNSPPEQNSVTKEQVENDKRVAGSTLTRTAKTGLQITRVTFTVSLPASYYRKVDRHQWRMENPNAKEEEYKPPTEPKLKLIKDEIASNIQAKLSPLLPKGLAGEDKLPKVTVTESIDMPIAPLPPTPMSSVAVEWLGTYWQTLALLGVVGVSLLSLRSFARANSGTNNDTDFERGFDIPLDDATDIDLSSLTDEESDSFVENTDSEPKIPKLRTTGGEVKGDLTTLVRENPDAAATLLRNWIGGNS